MPDNHRKIDDEPIRCISCRKIIAQGNMQAGRIVINCKCGVSNVIEARNKPEGRQAYYSPAGNKSSSILPFRTDAIGLNT